MGGVLAAVLLIEAIAQCGCCGLVNDPQDFQSSDGAGGLCGLPLGVVEVGGHCDDSLLDLSAEVPLGNLLHPSKHHGADLLGHKLLRRHALAGGDLDLELALVVLKDREG
mmetsp:Transcript_91639/g.264282  ORF Transcript_91639/g.264282 Transcript_91639/m.264282 type:complete len:110 (+) Transcript_91639:541-870(+)